MFLKRQSASSYFSFSHLLSKCFLFEILPQQFGNKTDTQKDTSQRLHTSYILYIYITEL